MDSLELLINVFSEKNMDFGAKDSNYGSITDLGMFPNIFVLQFSSSVK